MTDPPNHVFYSLYFTVLQYLKKLAGQGEGAPPRPGNPYREHRDMSFLSKPHLPSPNLFPMPQITQDRAPGNQRPCQSPKPSKIIQTSPPHSSKYSPRLTRASHRKPQPTAPGHALPSRFFPLLTNSGPSPRGPAWHGMPSSLWKYKE